MKYREKENKIQRERKKEKKDEFRDDDKMLG